ncbi:Protein SRC2 [Bienertia sinuspersici]
MRTYAIAWVHPDRKLTTRVDIHGGTNPTWNDKFIFRVDNQFLRSDTSAIMIEIYALHWFRDVHVGTVRVLVGNLIPPQTRSHNQNHIGMRFVALQVRRPSGRPQGILNVGVTVLDSTMRSMPLYAQLCTSAVGYQKLMGQDELHSHHQSSNQLLRRTKSEKSSFIGNNNNDHEDDQDYAIPNIKPNTSIINQPVNKTSNNNKGKLPSYDKPLSIIDGGENASSLNLAMKLKAQQGKAESVISCSEASSIKRPNKKASSSVVGESTNNVKQRNNKKHNWLPNYNAMSKDFAAGSIWTESEVGPSPSEVAAAMDDNKGSSMVMNDKWSSSIIDDSEGVRSKLERWRAEVPKSYGGGSSISSSTIFPRTRHNRRHTTDGGGKFSCFGNICGYECSIVCGKNGGRGGDGCKRKYAGRAPSIDSVSTYF